eukprot:m.133028 g.133028  ORF g.133028 m.133028 type:complete len:334 (+) comp13940_c0_seq26:472-1473(+)
MFYFEGVHVVESMTDTVAYLNSVIQNSSLKDIYDVQLAAEAPLRFVEAASYEEFDLFFASPESVGCIQAETGAAPLATIVRNSTYGTSPDPLSVTAGVIFTTRASGITTLDGIAADIKVAMPAPSQLNGGLSQQLAVFQATGVNTMLDAGMVVYESNPLALLRLVLDGKVDVGFLPAGALEELEEQSLVDIRRTLYILNAQIHNLSDGGLFPFFSSTQLFPEWAVGALPHVPRRLSSLITAALLSITSDSDAATSGGYDSWITADSYQFTQTAQELFNIITFDHIAQKKKCFRPTKMNAQRRLASASASMGTFVSRAFVSLHGVWVCTWPFLA